MKTGEGVRRQEAGVTDATNGAFRETKVAHPSEHFERAFSSRSSGCRRECSCGVIFFDISENRWDWDAGEREELERLAATRPKEFIGQDHAVGSITIAGVETIMGCPNCDPKAAKCEAWLIAHAEEVAAFLNARSAKLKQEAERTAVVS